MAGGSTNDPDRNTRTAVNTGGNSGDAVGSYEADQFKTHIHSMPRGGNVFGPNYAMNDVYNVIPTGGYETNPGTGDSTTGGTETRPKNVNVYYIIKT